MIKIKSSNGCDTYVLGNVQSQDKLLEVNTSTSIIVKYPEKSIHEERCLVTDYFLKQ